MSLSILTTKLYAPPPRASSVRRDALLQRLAVGTERPLTLISAPAGFGKTSLVSAWAETHDGPLAWLSLDESDGDLPRFLTYVITALQGVDATLGQGVLPALHSQSPPPMEQLLTALINDLNRLPEPVVLVLDDSHRPDSQAVDAALRYVLEHQPRTLRLVVVTREDPPWPLSRLRARGLLTEIRAADLRFDRDEASHFLRDCMGLALTETDIAMLDSRTEGWVAGLQLAAIALQDTADPIERIQAFNGSHQFVLDYLLDEVLSQQEPGLQDFLLKTAAFDRFCAELSDACLDQPDRPSRATLEALEHANLFLIPLDRERHWYRYHHLFGDLLRQRLKQLVSPSTLTDLHRRASQWFHDHDWPLEAFQHAVASGDIDLATQRVLGGPMPLQLRGEAAAVLDWLTGLSANVKHQRPELWVTQASALMMSGRLAGIATALEAAEAGLEHAPQSDERRNLEGHIAAIRAFLAVSRHDVADMQAQSQLALERLHPDNLPVRTAARWTLGHAQALKGERAEAMKAHTEALAVSDAIGHRIITILSTLGIGNLHEQNLKLSSAFETFESLLEQAGDPPLPIFSEAHLGLARIHYEWHELDRAEEHLNQASELAEQFDHLDRTVACDWLRARLMYAQGNVEPALAILMRTRQFARHQGFQFHGHDLWAEECRMRLQLGHSDADDGVDEQAPLECRVRIALARGDGEQALAWLEPAFREARDRGWVDRQFDYRRLQALAQQAVGRTSDALTSLREALQLAEPGGLIRRFVDEGPDMAQLLATARGQMADSGYLDRLLAMFEPTTSTRSPVSPDWVEPLSKRETVVLTMIAEGLSNQAISERLFLALSTVKGHNQRIFDKLGVRRRTEAVARAREWGLIP